MDDAVELSDLGGQVRRRWWLLAMFVVAGVVVGVLVAGRVPPVYRAQGTLLVGPINGDVTLSTTLRASESLATFYADLARRQVVLEPVTRELGLSEPWEKLRDQVSAVVPDQNPRVVTVTAADGDQAQAERITTAVVRKLIDLSPAPDKNSGSAFIGEQVQHLQTDIEAAEAEIARLDDEIAGETSPKVRDELMLRRTERQKLVDAWRNTYIELVTADPASDAGGLRVLDDVTSEASLDRGGLVRQAGLGGVVGLVLGLLAVWLMSGVLKRRPTDPARLTAPTVRPAGPTPASPRGVEETVPVPVPAGAAGSRDHDR